MTQRPPKKRKPLPPRPTVASTLALEGFRWDLIVKVLIIVALGFYIYGPSLHGLWLWDDDFLLQNNAEVHASTGIWYIWTDPSTLIDFFPLTVSVEWLIWQIFGSDARPPMFEPVNFYYHLTSVILHLCNALLVWHVFRKLGIKLAWLGAVIFTVHPVIVESVAWMAELKNTIGMPPFLIVISAWISWDRTRKWEYYALALFFYLVAMLCKTSVVAFPFVIMLYAWYKHGFLGKQGVFSSSELLGRFAWYRSIESKFPLLGKLGLLVETVPFFAVAGFIAFMLIAYLRHGVGEQFIPLGPVNTVSGCLSRVACAGLSLMFYFSKCVLPVNLMPIYPQWDINPPSWYQFWPWPLFALSFWLLWRQRNQRWGQVAILGFGYFFLNLLPFVGWRAISFMRFGWVMDHFLYVPILGLIGLAAAAAGHLHEILPASRSYARVGAVAALVGLLAYGYYEFTLDDYLGGTILSLIGVGIGVAGFFLEFMSVSTSARDARIGAMAALVCILAFGSREYTQVFVNRLAYWTYETERNWVAWPAHNNRGNELLQAGDYAGAEQEFLIALQLNPEYTEAHNNLGFIYKQQGHLKDAEREFRKALEYTPDFESSQINLAQTLQLETLELQK